MIHIYSDLEGISQAAAEIFIDAAQQAIHSHGRFSVALSGGSTPRRLYEILATPPFRDRVKWQSVHVFWGDERCVPMDDPRSNYRMAREALLDRVPLPGGNIHPMQGDLPPAEAARRYEVALRNYFRDQPPAMDLVLLGLGDNAHTASLFPHTPALNENVRWVTDVYVDAQDMHRITLTAPFINRAAQVVFLVSGADKARALQIVTEGAYQPHIYPAQLIHPNGAHPIWLVDKAASHKLTVEIEEEV
ncbi:MAG: 6-phosphogluconolactonase [Anaerolineales bacterium]|nr:6-phosphogluconolactonase [Anaerolineae bacterium]PWB69578.1 MAG: 6-phosphogluconolactonase [Anaerolineales bacterium]